MVLLIFVGACFNGCTQGIQSSSSNGNASKRRTGTMQYGVCATKKLNRHE
jgi:hypothetical protein